MLHIEIWYLIARALIHIILKNPSQVSPDKYKTYMNICICIYKCTQQELMSLTRNSSLRQQQIEPIITE